MLVRVFKLPGLLAMHRGGVGMGGEDCGVPRVPRIVLSAHALNLSSATELLLSTFTLGSAKIS